MLAHVNALALAVGEGLATDVTAERLDACVLVQMNCNKAFMVRHKLLWDIKSDILKKSLLVHLEMDAAVFICFVI